MRDLTLRIKGQPRHRGLPVHLTDLGKDLKELWGLEPGEKLFVVPRKPFDTCKKEPLPDDKMLQDVLTAEQRANPQGLVMLTRTKLGGESVSWDCCLKKGASIDRGQ